MAKKLSFSKISAAVLVISVLLFSSCKKYPEGGRIKKAEKNLRGGLNDEYTKRWSLTRYEVDGIDSTKTWKSKRSTDRFSYYDLEISPEGDFLLMETEVISLLAGLSADNRTLNIGPLDPENVNSVNCYRTNVCERNIFVPFVTSDKICSWTIVKLDQDELIMTLSGKSVYKIEMAYADAE